MFFTENKDYETLEEAIIEGYRLCDTVEKRIDIGIGDEHYYELIGIIAEDGIGNKRYYGTEW